MPSEDGKYDSDAVGVLLQLGADVVLLVVKNGPQGDGFSVAADSLRISEKELKTLLPSVLREVADSIEKQKN